MSQISLKSISGITSITTPASVDNQFTIHTNNTTEAFKLDHAGNIHIHNHVNTTGISSASNFKTGTSNLHNTGLNVQDLDVDGHTNLDNASVAGITTYSKSGSALRLNDGSILRLGNVDADYFLFYDGGSDLAYLSVGAGRDLRITTDDFKVYGANNTELILRGQKDGPVSLYYDNAVRCETSTKGITVGTGVTVETNGQATFTGIVTASTYYGDGSNLSNITSTTINNNADNRIITGSGTANTLEGESTLTYDGTNLDLGDGKYVRLGASNDFQMWHNGGTGNTNIKQVTGDMYFYTGSDLNMHIKDGTSVDLYYANAKKFETTSSGATVTGDLKAINSGGVTLRVGSTNAGAAALYLDGDSDGDWSGATFAHVTHDTSGNLNIMSRNPAGNAHIIFGTNDYNAFRVDENRHIRPESDNARDLGTSSYRWRNLYTTDLQLSNKGSENEVDGTWGDWTLQEGESKIFMINNRTGKKYSLKMEEE